MPIQEITQEEIAEEKQPRKRKPAPKAVVPAGMDLPDTIAQAVANQSAGVKPTVGARFNQIELPSKGLCGYPAEIGYRDIMVRDEKIIASATPKTFQKTIGDVLKSLLEDQSIYPDLTIFDRDYLLTWIWANNYSTQKSFVSECPHCGTENKIDLDLTEVPVLEIKEDYPAEGLTIPMASGDTATINLITIKDEQVAQEYCKRHKDTDEALVSIASAIEFGSAEMPLPMKVKYMEDNMTGREMAMVRAFFDYFKFGMLDDYEYNCSDCGEAVKTSIPFSVDHFFPTVQPDIKGMLRS